MKNRIIIVAVITISFSTIGFSQTYEWTKAFGSNYWEHGTSVETDALGNVYVTGSFSNTIDFDPGPGTSYISSNGDLDAFIQKFDASGNLIWVKTIGGNSADYSNDIALDNAGNVYITGAFKYTVDFNPGSGVDNHTAKTNGLIHNEDAFVLKLDKFGNFIWAKTYGGYSDDEGISLVVCDSGNVYITGVFAGTTDLNPSAGTSYYQSNGDDDIYIQKLDSLGTFIWAKVIGSSYYDITKSITVDMFGDVYIAGEFKNGVDFDPDTTFYYLSSNGNFDVFVLKLKSSGQFDWAKSFGSSYVDYGNSITMYDQTSILIVGRFAYSTDFDPGLGSDSLFGYQDLFIQKLDTAGNYLWAKAIGGNYMEEANSVAVDIAGNIYLTGTFQDSVDFDPGLGIDFRRSNGQEDMFVVKLDNSANYLWASTFGGSIEEKSNAIAVDDYGNIYVTGSFYGTVDFEPGLGTDSISSNGWLDYFLWKSYDCIITINNKVVVACDSFSFNNTVLTTSGVYYDTLTNAGGCDSIIILDLTINPSTSDILNHTFCFTYTSPSGNHIWDTTGTYLDTIPNANGCDSIITINLTIITVDTSITKIVAISGFTTLITNQTGAKYQWLDCNNAYAILLGDTNQSFSPNLIGNYAVEITSNGCVDTSSCISVTQVGIMENDFGSSFNFYPNPTSGKITVDLGKSYKEIDVIVRNTLGQIVLSKYFKTSSLLSFKIDDSPGVYFVEIKTDNGKSAVFRVVKE